MKALIVIFFATFGAFAAHGEDLNSERIWTGRNGKVFRGTFMRVIPGEEKIQILSVSNEVFTIDIANLSEKDAKLVLEKPDDIPANADHGDPSLFKPEPPLDRTAFVFFAQEKLGMSWRSATEAASTTIFWWDLQGWIPIPRRGDEAKKQSWVLNRLERFTDPRGTTAARTQDLMNGLADYFDDELDGIATYRIRLIHEQTPENLVKYVTGGNLCIIYTRVGSYGVWFPVLEAQADGSLTLGCDGKVIRAKLAAGGKKPGYSTRFQVEIPLPRGGKSAYTKQITVPEPSAQIVVQNQEELPDWIRETDMQFTISPRDPMIVLRPYLYVKEGDASPPPPDPLMELEKEGQE